MSLTKVLPPNVKSNLEPSYDFEDAASCFLEISNPQRIAILSILENDIPSRAKLERTTRIGPNKIIENGGLS